MLQIKKVDISQADILLNLSRETFFAAFAHLNDSADMAIYAESAFTITKLKAELNNPDSVFNFAIKDENIVGYLKLNYGNAQTEFKDDNGLEVERIYVSVNHQNKSIGLQLLNFAQQQAISNNLNYIWLGVWEHNKKAIRFYERNGFKIFAEHDFMLGNDKQTDLLLRKTLT